MDTLLQDLKFAFRSLARRPGFSVTVGLTLALGIGANTALFGVVNAVLLRELPYPEPDRLVRVWSAYPERGVEHGTASPHDLRDWREQVGSFEALSAYPAIPASEYVRTDGDRPESYTVSFVQEEFFETLGTPAMLGRTLGPADHLEGNNRVVVLAHGTWRADPDLVGSSLTLNGAPFTVIGVMPPGFSYPRAGTEMWTPASLIPDSGIPRRREVRWLQVVGRLEPGVGVEQAEAELSAVARQLAEAYPDSNEQLTAVTVTPLREFLVGDVRTPLLALLGAVGAVLLVGCANVANLMLARSEERHRELAVRQAMGAGRGRLVRQLLTESVLLALGGGIGGLCLAAGALRALPALAPAEIPRLGEVGIDPSVLLFTFLLSALTGVLFGLAPALRTRRMDLVDDLKEGARGASESRGRRVRGLLVAAEAALVVVLVVGASLMARSLENLLNVDPGFDPHGALALRLEAAGYRYPDSEDISAFYRDVVERVSQVPGIEAAGVGRPLPLGLDTFQGEDMELEVDGAPPSPDGEMPSAMLRFTSPGFFEAMGIPLLAGRTFTTADTRESEVLLAVVNRTMAERYWPGESPVGRTLMDGRIRVIGVVGDVRQTRLDEEVEPALYTTVGQVQRRGMTLIVRTDSDLADPFALLGNVRQAIWEVNPEQPIEEVATLEDVVAQSVSERRFSTLLLGLFTALALALAAVGIYGVVAYSVGRRQHEIGIRMALGARTRDVLGMLVQQGMAYVVAGLVVGVPAALALSRLVSSLLYGVAPTDPLTYGLAVLILVTVSLAAILLPAMRATRIDPVRALHAE